MTLSQEQAKVFSDQVQANGNTSTASTPKGTGENDKDALGEEGENKNDPVIFI